MAGHYNPRDKEKTQEWARTLFKLDNFYVLDTETTGLKKQDEIVQLGIVDKHGKTVFNSLVKPTKPVPFDAMAIHGITNDMLENAPRFSELYVQISSLLAGQPLIAYNMEFDWRLLAQTNAIYKLPNFFTGTRHCAMIEYARYKGQFDIQKRIYRYYSLSAACKQQHIVVENAHDALGDVRMTLALMQKMAQL